jgi:hypothetical protein
MLSNQKISLVTVATDPNKNTFKMWEKTVRKAGWQNNYKVLGLNQKWQGWSWRCKILSEYCGKLNYEDIVLICDSYDLLVFGSMDEVNQLYKKSQTDIIFGVESACGVNCEKPIKPGISLNAGCLIGKAGVLSKAYDWIGKNHSDDQMGWYNYLQKSKNITYTFDKEQNLVINYQYGSLNDIGKKTYYLPEICKEYFIGVLFPKITRKYLKIDKNNRPTTINNIKPIMVHLPGSRYDHNMLYKDVIRRVKNLGEIEGLDLNFFSAIIKVLCMIIIFSIIYVIYFYQVASKKMKVFRYKKSKSSKIKNKKQKSK